TGRFWHAAPALRPPEMGPRDIPAYPGTMPEPVSPAEGWNVLHLFCRVTPDADGTALAAAVKELEADGHQVVSAAIVGHKADVCLMALGADMWRMRRFQTEVVAAGFA